MAMAPPKKSSSSLKSKAGTDSLHNQPAAILTTRRNRPVKRQTHARCSKQRPTTSEVLKHLLHEEDKENDYLSTEDIRDKPDLWMAAFDNPMDFIQYCRKRLDHERKLMERSRKMEQKIADLLEKWTEKTESYVTMQNDLLKVQSINDKLMEIVMEERTHCQHLIGVNNQLKIEKKIMSRKFQAALVLGKVDEKSVEHLLEKDPKVIPLTDKVSELSEKIKKCDSKNIKKQCSDPVVLAEKVRRLESHIESLKKQHREEVAVLKDTIAQYDSKCESITMQYQELLKRNSDTMLELKECFNYTFQENMELRNELLKKDDKFIQVQMDEIKAMTRKRPTRQTKSLDEIGEAFEEANAIEKDLKVRLAKTEIELVEKSNILRDAMSKLVMLDQLCTRMEDENLTIKKNHDRCIAVLKERAEVLEKRCEKTEERRRLDNLGFREDIRELKQLLQNVNKNVRTFTRFYSDPKIRAKGFDQVTDEDLNRVLVDRSKKSREWIKHWLKTGDPVLSQKVVTTWTDYIGHKVEELDGKIKKAGKETVEDKEVLKGNKTEDVVDEMFLIYDNKANVQESVESSIPTSLKGHTSPKGRTSRKVQTSPKGCTSPKGRTSPKRHSSPKGRTSPKRRSSPKGRTSPKRRASPKRRPSPPEDHVTSKRHVSLKDTVSLRRANLPKGTGSVKSNAAAAKDNAYLKDTGSVKETTSLKYNNSLEGSIPLLGNNSMKGIITSLDGYYSNADEDQDSDCTTYADPPTENSSKCSAVGIMLV